MEKRHKITQLYGYMICLVSIITFLIAMTAMVSAIIDLSNPFQSRSSYSRSSGPSLASFDNYKMDLMISLKEGQQLPDDQTLKIMYESAKNDIIQNVSFRAKRDITVDIMIILVCLILFSTHWFWMRKLSKTEAG
ncbi:hypothetical protein CEE37_10115 [candidate division LCP-89 bacterium B3_LCP]|uniref:Uncharacterized protein n=1 Tax=candidate division LCP-89 bacterium B3_LCP TaxID=2012998 RepID=A0A532UYP4_UNCL8|nr:MAG: hypothetical protein CEE37_10115 [candidate division LCP-89 bacterium B3_LCP]